MACLRVTSGCQPATIASLWFDRRKRQHGSGGQRPHQESAVKAAVAGLAARLRDKQTSVTGSAVQRAVVVKFVRRVFAADRVVGAEVDPFKASRHESGNFTGHV